MRPKNFPMRKLVRQHRAAGTTPSQADLTAARDVRTKKRGDRISRQARAR